jgi:hypothetical protein
MLEQEKSTSTLMAKRRSLTLAYVGAMLHDKNQVWAEPTVDGP